MDHILIANCPTKLEFKAIDVTKPKKQILVELYNSNTKMCVIIMLGQGKSRMVLLNKTKMMFIPMN